MRLLNRVYMWDPPPLIVLDNAHAVYLRKRVRQGCSIPHVCLMVAA